MSAHQYPIAINIVRDGRCVECAAFEFDRPRMRYGSIPFEQLHRLPQGGDRYLGNGRGQMGCYALGVRGVMQISVK